MGPHEECSRGVVQQPRYEVGDIFREHGKAYRASHVLTPEQHRVMRDIETCRTAELGGHMDKCVDCGHKRPSYNSCRNRHCPKCQSLDQAKWLEGRKRHILPVYYFHVVFTLPGELRALALWNRREVFNILFGAASQTLLALGRDPKRLGAHIGFTAVLHTWTRDLRFHPHVHCIVTGGGLSLDETSWLDTGPKHLLPVNVMGRLFRGKFLHALQQAYEKGLLDLPDDLALPSAFARLRRQLFDKDWVVYAKRPFAGPEQVYTYLGRYTHRVGISNYRLIEVTDTAVTIATRRKQTATMGPEEFIRRFLLHLLAKRFVKIRHYGLMASSNVNTRLALARRLLAEQGRVFNRAYEPIDDWRALFERLTGIDLRICPACGSKRLVRSPMVASVAGSQTAARAPPPAEVAP